MMDVCQNCLRTDEVLGNDLYPSSLEVVEVSVIDGRTPRRQLTLCGRCAEYLASGRMCGMFDRHQCPPTAERAT